MKRIADYEAVRDFLSEVCGISARGKRTGKSSWSCKAIWKNSLRKMLQQGVTEEEAVLRAIGRMGNPAELGMQLHRTHKPRTDWSMPGLLVIPLGIGLMATCAVDLAEPRFGGRSGTYVASTDRKVVEAARYSAVSKAIEACSGLGGEQLQFVKRPGTLTYPGWTDPATNRLFLVYFRQQLPKERSGIPFLFCRFLATLTFWSIPAFDRVFQSPAHSSCCRIA